MDRFAKLTARERECLIGAAQLRQSKEIARDLGVRKATVDKHFANAVRKLQAVSRRDAALMLVRYMRASGLPIAYQGQRIPLSFDPVSSADGGEKGGAHAPFGDPDPDGHLGRSGSGVRRPVDHAGGKGDGAASADDDASAQSASLAARSDSRDYLHRFRSDARERSTATEPVKPNVRSPFLRLMLVMAAAVAIGVVTVGILSSAIQIGHLAQVFDDRLAPY